MKLKILMENTAFQTDVKAEHGFSLFIENNKDKILFDLGQTDALLHNAKLFEIELEEIEHVVLSHGHYDHTGATEAFLKANKKAKFYVKRGFDCNRFSAERYVGVPRTCQIPQERVIYIDKPTEISEGIYVMPDIDIHDSQDTHFNKFKIKEAFETHDDTFHDELYLAITKDEKLSIISGCAHRGISNIIETASKFFKLPLNLILGGFHIKNESVKKIDHLANRLNSFGIEQMCPCHCTGIESYVLLKSACPAIKMQYGHVGLNYFL